MSTAIDNIIDNDESWETSLKQAFSQNEVERTGEVGANIDSVNAQGVLMGNNPSDAELRAHYGTPTKDSVQIAIRQSNGRAYIIFYDLDQDKFFFEQLTEAN